MIRYGEVSIIDASVIEAKQNRPAKCKDNKNTQDPEAAYNVKNGSDGKRKTTYGFKAQINVEEDGFIKTYDYSAGNVHDSNVFESMFTGSEEEVYADSAYQSKILKKRTKEKGTRNRVLKRAYRNKPLTEAQKQLNRMNSGVRCTVERVFAILKLYYGMARAPDTLGRHVNRARFGLLCLAYNMKRGVSVQHD